jgi:uncharacterized protein
MGEGDNREVVEDRTNHRFVIEEDGVIAELSYRHNGNRLILVHTEVPKFLEGRGIGARLGQAAVRTAAAEGLTVVPWCPFARKWLEGHPDEAGTVTIDWSLPD